MHYFEEHLPSEERNAIPYLSTTVQFLDYISEHYGDSIALSDQNQAVSYSELAIRVSRRRHGLEELHLPPRCNVGLFDTNSIAAVEWFLALTTTGPTAVMLPSALSEAVLIHAVQHYELKAIITGPTLIEKTNSLSIPIVPAYFLERNGEPPAFVTKNDCAAIFFTGGTTGTPKGVMLNHGAIMRGALNGTYRDGTMFGQTMVAALPFTHVFGMVFSMLSGLYTGSHMAVCGNMRDLFKEMARAKPTTMIAVPGMAEMMLTVAQKRGVQALGGRLKLIICGAAPVPERLMYSFKPYGIRVLSGYGMTETANLVCGNLEQETHPDSVGRQYPCQKARIVNGELQVKGDMLFSGYWKDEATTRAAFDGDWLKSGDLARVDEDGFIHIIGRIKNLIILGNGENVSPEEVEEVFYRSVCVQDCLVSETKIAGRPAIQLEVFPIDDVTDETLEQEMKRISDTLPTTMRPARILIRHEPFEKSASLKIIRKK